MQGFALGRVTYHHPNQQQSRFFLSCLPWSPFHGRPRLSEDQSVLDMLPNSVDLRALRSTCIHNWFGGTALLISEPPCDLRIAMNHFQLPVYRFLACK